MLPVDPEHPAPFVGRGPLLERLHGMYRSAAQGRGSGALVRGEAGVGKTSLLRQMADRVRAAGGQVLLAHGRCEASAPALWPWIEVVRAVRRMTPPLERDMRPLLRVFGPWLGGIAPADACDPLKEPGSQFMLFDALIQLVLDTATHAPVCLVLEDLHEFDTYSRKVLHALLPQLQASRVFVLASCRTDLQDPEALELLHGFEHRLLLTGLSADEVQALLELGLGRRVSPTLAASVHRRSDGNPLYVRSVTETLSTLQVSAPDAVDLNQLCLPGSVLRATQGQLDRLSPACRRVLQRAAILGREFAVDELTRFASLRSGRGAVLRALAEGCRHGVLVPVPKPDEAYRFGHILIRESLEREMQREALVVAHSEAADALSPPDGHCDEYLSGRIAQHWLSVGSSHALTQAQHHAERAGRAARARGAHAEAADNLELVVAARRQQIAITRDGPATAASQRRLAKALLALAAARWPAGQPRLGLDHALEALQLARALGDTSLITEAVLVGLDHELRSWIAPAELEVWEVALGECVCTSPDTTIRLRAGWGIALSRARPHEAHALVLEAERLAQADVSTSARLLTLRARANLIPERDHDGRKALLDRHARLAASCGDPGELAWSHGMHLCLAQEAADPAAVQHHERAFSRIAPRAGEHMVWWACVLRCSRALLEGRLKDAERAAFEAQRLGKHVPGADVVSFAQWAWTLRLKGRGEETVPFWKAAVERDITTREARAGLALAYVELDRMAEARVELSRALALAPSTLAASCGLAECAWALGDTAIGEALLEELRPFSDRCAVSTSGAVCLGSIAHFCGVAALAAGMPTEGLRYLERAFEVNRQLGAMPALCSTHFELGRGLLEAGRTGEATTHVRDSIRIAQQIGMPLMARRAANLLADIDARRDRDQQTVATSAPQQRFALCGDIWELEYRGRTARVSDLKGMHCLAALLARPRERLHVLELAAGPNADGPATRTAHQDEALDRTTSSLEAYEAGLDGHSVVQYRSRLRDLAQELDACEQANDMSRKQALLQEQEFLLRELQSGARGRHRPTERARKAVYNRIRQAIKHIDGHHPELARHLMLTVKTGVHCGYLPEGEAKWGLAN